MNPTNDKGPLSVKEGHAPHPQWFIDQHTKLFSAVAKDAEQLLTPAEAGMAHPHGITETAYRHYIWDLIFSGWRIVEERDDYRASLATVEMERDAMREALVLAEVALNHMGDVMNDMDIVEDEDIEITTRAFKAIRALLSPSSEAGKGDV